MNMQANEYHTLLKNKIQLGKFEILLALSDDWWIVLASHPEDEKGHQEAV